MVSALLLLPQVARAATIFGASSGGRTEAQSCNADVWFIVVPVVLDISSGDSVQIWFNVTLYDNRSVGSSDAYHYFKVNWTYGMGSGYNDLNKKTNGGNAYGYYPIPVTASNLQPPGTLGITWFASITVTTPYCFDSDSKVHNIGLV